MNEALNQDTGPHESRRRLSWRRGMGPSVAAYEWLTDSQCFWHQLKECEEVAKIRAAARCTSSPQSKTSKPKYARAPFVTLTFYKIAGRRGGGAAAFFFLFLKCEKSSPQYIHYTYIPLAGIACRVNLFFCVKILFQRNPSSPPLFCVLSAWLRPPGCCAAEWFIVFYDGHWHFVWSRRDNLINCCGPENRKLILV